MTLRACRVFAFVVFVASSPSLSHGDGRVHPDPVVTYRLSNGLTVLLLSVKRLPVVAVAVTYRVGTADDPPARSGLAHMLEHLSLTDGGRFSEDALRKRLTRRGITQGAATDFDTTLYHFFGPSRELPLMLQVTATRMAALSVSEATLEREKEVVLREASQRFEQNQLGRAYARFRELLFPGNDPYHRLGAGERAAVAHFSVAVAKSMHADYYAPNNAALAVVGDFDAQAVRTLIQRDFGNLSARDIKRAVVPEVNRGGRSAGVETSDPSATLLKFGWRAPPPTADAVAQLDAISRSLADGDSGILKSLRVDGRVIAKGAQCSVREHRRNTVFGCDLFLHPGVDLARASEAVGRVMASIRKDGLSESEIKRASAHWRRGTLTSLESSRTAAMYLSWYAIVVGDPQFLNSLADSYSRLSPRSTSEAARQLLPEVEMIMLAAGGE